MRCIATWFPLFVAPPCTTAVVLKHMHMSAGSGFEFVISFWNRRYYLRSDVIKSSSTNTNVYPRYGQLWITVAVFFSDARDYCVCSRVVHSMLANVRAPCAKKNLSVRCLLRFSVSVYLRAHVWQCAYVAVYCSHVLVQHSVYSSKCATCTGTNVRGACVGVSTASASHLLLCLRQWNYNGYIILLHTYTHHFAKVVVRITISAYVRMLIEPFLIGTYTNGLRRVTEIDLKCTYQETGQVEHHNQ